MISIVRYRRYQIYGLIHAGVLSSHCHETIHAPLLVIAEIKMGRINEALSSVCQGVEWRPQLTGVKSWE